MSLSSIELIQNYASSSEIQKLENTLQEKNRTSLVTDKYFIKINTFTNKESHILLLKELHIFESLKSSNLHIPELITFFQNEMYIVLVFERILGRTLGARRNNFTIKPDIDIEYLSSEIINISKIISYSPNLEVLDRNKKLDQYFKTISNELDQDTKRCTNNLIGKMGQNRDSVFSHGDLIPTNIMTDGKQYYFIDWEWAGLRPDTYDITLFILFSGNPIEQLSRLKYLKDLFDLQDVYKDAVIISAREIKNWLQIDQPMKQRKYIDIWSKVLKEAEKLLL